MTWSRCSPVLPHSVFFYDISVVLPSGQLESNAVVDDHQSNFFCTSNGFQCIHCIHSTPLHLGDDYKISSYNSVPIEDFCPSFHSPVWSWLLSVLSREVTLPWHSSSRHAAPQHWSNIFVSSEEEWSSWIRGKGRWVSYCLWFPLLFLGIIYAYPGQCCYLLQDRKTANVVPCGQHLALEYRSC